MVIQPMVSGGGGAQTFAFTFNYPDSANCYLNDEPISSGDTVSLEAGSYNVLYAPTEAVTFETESGKRVPYYVSATPPLTRAPAPNYYSSFIMPAENCSYLYL